MSLLNLLRIRDVRNPRERWKLTAYEMAFRLLCRHRQGPRRNILLFCTRRGGSTWIMNSLAAHPAMRYVGRPFMVALYSRWRHELPDLAAAAQYDGDYVFECFVQFEGDAEARFRQFARRIVVGERHICPTLNFRAPYFHRVTDRVVFQMTNETALIEWFDEYFPADTFVLLRHPIPNALSIMTRKWRHECGDFLNHRRFVETHLTAEQVDLARRVVQDGSALAKHVLDWSLKMLVPVRAIESGRHSNWLVMTYEQAVLEPDRVVEIIARRLDFSDTNAMREQIQRPSRTIAADTTDRVDDPNYLITRWRRNIDHREEEQLMRIPAAFGIEVYTPGRDVAADQYLHGMPAPVP